MTNYIDEYTEITKLLGESYEYLYDSLSKLTLTAAIGDPGAEIVAFYGNHFASYAGEVAVGEVPLPGLPPWQRVKFCTKAICAMPASMAFRTALTGPDICMWMVENYDRNDPSFPQFVIVVRKGFLSTPLGASLAADIAVASDNDPF